MELLTGNLDIGKIYNQQNKDNKLLQIVVTQYNDGEENIKLFTKRFPNICLSPSLIIITPIFEKSTIR